MPANAKASPSKTQSPSWDAGGNGAGAARMSVATSCTVEVPLTANTTSFFEADAAQKKAGSSTTGSRASGPSGKPRANRSARPCCFATSCTHVGDAS